MCAALLQKLQVKISGLEFFVSIEFEQRAIVLYAARKSSELAILSNPVEMKF